MNILLTGGSGFIGRNIIEHLSPKYRIFAPSHQELDLLNEVAVKQYFQRNQIDIVIHSAVKPGHRNAKDPSNLCYSNTRMFFNLVRNAALFDRMIFLSSGAVYDVSKNLVKVSEDSFDTYVPADEHGFAKYISAKYVENVKNITELRLFGVFGKYEDYSIRFISNAICKALHNLPITLKQNRKFDYVYIDDFIPILEYFIQNNSQHNVYNITPNESVELLAIAQTVVRLSGKDIPIHIAQEGMGNEYSGSNNRLRQELSSYLNPIFNPLEENVKRLMAWYSDNLNLIDRQLLLFDK